MGIGTLLAKRQTETLLERVQIADARDRIDRDAGKIKGVKILGRVSKNGREYSDGAMREACDLYQGMEVNIDHPSARKANASREMRENWAMLDACQVRVDGVYGDLSYLTKHAETPAILERIDKGFRIGMSHNAAGRTKTRNGKTIVESVTRVNSVDLVMRPATNENLFESEDQTMIVTVKSICESHKEKFPSWAAMLSEMEGDHSVASLPVETGPAMGADDQVAEAFKAAIMGVLDSDLDMAGKMSKIKELLRAEDKVKGKSEDTTPPSEPAKEEPTKESVEQAPAFKALQEQMAAVIRRDVLRSVMESHNMTRASIGADRYSLLESQADAVAMESIIKTWPPHIQNGGARLTADLQLNEQQGEYKPPATTKGVMARLRGR